MLDLLEHSEQPGEVLGLCRPSAQMNKPKPRGVRLAPRSEKRVSAQEPMLLPSGPSNKRRTRALSRIPHSLQRVSSNDHPSHSTSQAEGAWLLRDT